MAKLADAPDLGSGAERLGGSSPPSRIRLTFSFNPEVATVRRIAAGVFAGRPARLRARATQRSRCGPTDAERGRDVLAHESRTAAFFRSSHASTADEEWDMTVRSAHHSADRTWSETIELQGHHVIDGRLSTSRPRRPARTPSSTSKINFVMTAGGTRDVSPDR